MNIYTLLNVKCYRKGDPLPGPETGPFSNTRKWIVWGDTCADKARDFIGKVTRVESSGVREPGELLCHVACRPRVYGGGIKTNPNWLSLANHSDSESFMAVHALFSQDGCQREGFWEVVRHVVSPFDLSQTLPVDSMFLTRTSCRKTAHANSHCGARPGWVVSVSVLPLTTPH